MLNFLNIKLYFYFSNYILLNIKFYFYFSNYILFYNYTPYDLENYEIVFYFIDVVWLVSDTERVSTS